jgi:predicted kinase
MEQKYLFMLLGHPGSGKTHFSEQLATSIGAVRVNADAMRVAALGTIEKAREFNDKTGLLNSIVFGALDYVAVQVLKSGNSVICDHQHNEKLNRDKRIELAKENGATAVVIWVKAPREIAVQRGSEREERLDQRQHSAEKMEALVDKYIGLLEVPAEDEKVIVIDGTAMYEEQYSSFTRQLAEVMR